ncbi:hypothetical protein MM_3366 [Methanosarcina mazei Go1]|uniref:Uncharacterized protein n=1 Tax=Methanosarcina mazei (strain ATCC BAA-159 / DSM 3647 / Goe1 / Go1 / JCM 11833 / OCM 88) TaxID=192952 RepID=Q8PRS7_METMA|nr:hypothetical protein MM_3366 [Methanosarcina mazei Go1]
MDLAHESLQTLEGWATNGVSILVLVDLAHEYKKIEQKEALEFGFNPCFSGSCSRILM